jgi:starch synthase (maltosyl-transferring)
MTRPSTRLPAARPPRVIIDAVLPEIDDGRFPAKRTAGERFEVTTHIVADGHDLVDGVLQLRPEAGGEWTEVRLEALGNDEYRARVTARTPGRGRPTSSVA